MHLKVEWFGRESSGQGEVGGGGGGGSVSPLQDDESIPSDTPVILLLVDTYRHSD